MRITVTGAAGFIGQRLVRRLLESGHEVRALVRQPITAAWTHDVELVSCDVTQPPSLAGHLDRSEIVFHLAACTIGRSRDDFFAVNRQGTINIAQECAQQLTPPRLVYVSSLAAAGPARNQQPRVESDPPQPISHYGASKLAAEQALLQMAARVPVQIARPGSVFGSDDRYMLPLFKMAAKGWVFVPGSRDQCYSLVHVDDAVDALIRLAFADESFTYDQAGTDNALSRGTLFIAQPTPLTFPEIAREVAGALTAGGVRRVAIPRFVCWSVAAINSAVTRTTPLRPLLNLDKMREAMAGSWMCDTSKLTEKLGFQFQVSLRQRICQTAQGYREKGKIP